MDYLLYWKPQTVNLTLARGGSLDHAASEQLHRVSTGDTLWIVTVRSGSLRLIARLRVGHVTDREGASRLLGTDDLWEANHHVVAQDNTAEALTEVGIDHLASSLRFESQAGKDRLAIDDGYVKAQQLQTMRILTWESALSLQQIWEKTDERPMQ